MDNNEKVDFCLEFAAVGRCIGGEVGEKILNIAKKHLAQSAHQLLFGHIVGVDKSGTS